MESSKNHLVSILQNYLKKEGYSIANENFKLQLTSNPSYPSVKSVTDTLDYFNISNIAANVPKDALDQLPDFFLAILNEGIESSMAQVEQKSNVIKLFNNDGSKETVSVEEFKKSWNGTLIAIEKNTLASNGSLSWFSSPITLLVLLTIFGLGRSILNFNFLTVVFSSLTCIGVWLSYFIIQEDLGVYNDTTSKICNSAKQNASCSDVISSKTSKLFSRFALSDISAVYFVGSIVLLAIYGFQASFFVTLSILSVPVLIYSIYAQAVQIKKWCPLCIGVAVTIVGQGIVASILLTGFSFALEYFTAAGIIYMTIYLLWFNAKKMVSNSISLRQVKIDFLKFRRNEELFETLLKKKSIQPVQVPETVISFGNPNAMLIINAITNPLCGFCTKSFKTYEKLLKTHGDGFKLNLIFNVPADSLEQQSSQIAQQLINLYSNDLEQAYLALQDWFNNREVSEWQTTYGTPNLSCDLTSLQEQLNWCNVNDINYTPATLINTSFFPKEYDIEDLPLFMDFLIENAIKSPEVITINNAMVS